MSLDASVYCDCVEKGELLKPHPYPELLCIGGDGCPDIRSDDVSKQNEHLDWLFSSPCRHGNCNLVDYLIGNIGLVAAFRGILDQLSDDPENEYPILRTKFIYNGIHCGDYLTIADVNNLKAEIERLRLANLAPVDKDMIDYWQDFLLKAEGLITASLSVNKPIVF